MKKNGERRLRDKIRLMQAAVYNGPKEGFVEEEEEGSGGL